MDILLKSDARKTKENVFFFLRTTAHAHMCVRWLQKKCKCHSRHKSLFFFFNIFIMNKAFLYLKQFLKIYNPLALFILLLTYRRGIGKAHN